jgi:excinuclease ABC subunit B
MPEFEIVSGFKPTGDQPEAIKGISDGFRAGRKFQTLMGVTGSGKTFTMANVIAHFNRPALVMSHDKTLAAQLYCEFKEFFPNNAVAYFVSYYDYYQPEAYIPQRDIYIEKDASINEEIDRLRLSATSSLVTRRDTIIVASVSCIYGLGSPEDYRNMMVALKTGDEIIRDKMLARLIDIQYDRNDIAFERGQFRVRGDSVEIWPSCEEYAVRVEFWGDEIEQISIINPLTGETIRREKEYYVYPAKHFVMPEERINAASSHEADLVADELDSAKLHADLLTVIEELPQRERELLTQHYGLDQNRPALSLSEIGDKMGITKVRVRQLEARALRKLRQLLDARKEKLRKRSE